MFWVFFVFWVGIFATIALIIVVHRRFGRSNPEFKHERIGRDEFDKKAKSETSYGGWKRRDGIVWSVVLWVVFLATMWGGA